MDKHTLTNFVVDGDRYADTAHLSPHDLEKVIVTDLTDPNNPYTLPAHFTYEITVDTTGPLSHLLVQVGGITSADGEMAADAALVTIHHAIKQYGQLRGIFERNLRFDHTLIVITPTAGCLVEAGGALCIDPGVVALAVVSAWATDHPSFGLSG